MITLVFMLRSGWRRTLSCSCHSCCQRTTTAVTSSGGFPQGCSSSFPHFRCVWVCVCVKWRSSALSGSKMLLVRIVENNEIDSYSRAVQVKLRGYLFSPKWIGRISYFSRFFFKRHLPIFKVGMAIRNPNLTTFLDQKRIRIRNLNCGLLIFTTFVAFKKNIFSQYLSCLFKVRLG